jgi:FG-GAP repeat
VIGRRRVLGAAVGVALMAGPAIAWASPAGAVAAPRQAGAVMAAGASAAGGGGGAGTSGDFDGDGFDDLAVGAPGEDFAAVQDSGNVTVAYGSAAGLGGRAEVVRQALGALGGYPERFDNFGSAVAAGDFDGDGFDDLAAGASGESVGGPVPNNEGAVSVAYGSPHGLVASNHGQYLRQGTGFVPGALESDDRFGASLAAGDVDGDGFDDLAVGAPTEDVGTTEDAGNVTLLFGSPSGLASAQIVRQGLDGLVGTAETADLFGWAVATGDKDGDGFDDLFVGAPGEAVGSVPAAGNVTIVPGRPTGAGVGSARPLNAGTLSCRCVQAGAFLGWSLSSGDLTVDGFDEVAVGAPFWDAGSEAQSAGHVTVVFGTPDDSDPDTPITEQRVGFAVEADDEFGYAVAIGRLDDVGPEDLLVGAPGEDVGSVEQAGLLVLVPGAGAEFPNGGAGFHQGSFAGTPEVGDFFGAALAVGDYSGDHGGDVAVGAPLEDVGSVVDAGNVVVHDSTMPGPIALNQGSLVGTTEADDRFGSAMA